MEEYVNAQLQAPDWVTFTKDFASADAYTKQVKKWLEFHYSSYAGEESNNLLV